MTPILTILAALCLLPSLREAVRQPVARQRLGERDQSLARLPQGATRYRWFGPEGGPVVVAVHGLTSPSEVFDGLALTLAQDGFRVLSNDLYGRGLSDRPGESQTAAHFLRQLEDLLADQELVQPVTLVGYSMGGVICSVFAARHPARVATLVLLAPAGMGLVLTRFWRIARDWPVLGTGMALGGGDLDLRRGLAASGPLRQAHLRQLRRRGYLGAVLSSLRGCLSLSLEQAQRQIARDGVPTLAIWGETDTVIPGTAAGRLARWHRSAEQEVIKDAGHTLPATHPERIAELVVAFHARRTA